MGDGVYAGDFDQEEWDRRHRLHDEELRSRGPRMPPTNPVHGSYGRSAYGYVTDEGAKNEGAKNEGAKNAYADAEALIQTRQSAARWGEIVTTWNTCHAANYDPDEIGDILYTLVAGFLSRTPWDPTPDEQLAQMHEASIERIRSTSPYTSSRRPLSDDGK